jgi:hypothetical protein
MLGSRSLHVAVKQSLTERAAHLAPLAVRPFGASSAGDCTYVACRRLREELTTNDPGTSQETASDV